MTWGEAELMKHLQTISKLDLNNPYIPITISLDFEKWNNRWRKGSTDGVFKMIDQLWGTPNLMTSTHKFFEKSWFYLSSNLNPPEYLKKNATKQSGVQQEADSPIKLADTFQESETTWYKQEGGCEGLRQKGWTCVTIGMLLAAEYMTKVKSIITGQGDNQVIVAFFPIRVPGISREEYSRNYSHILEKDIRDFLLVLKKLSNDIGMNIKLEETWVSQHLMNYGKEILVDGVFTTSVFKKISRTYLSKDETKIEAEKDETKVEKKSGILESIFGKKKKHKKAKSAPTIVGKEGTYIGMQTYKCIGSHQVGPGKKKMQRLYVLEMNKHGNMKARKTTKYEIYNAMATIPKTYVSHQQGPPHLRSAPSAKQTVLLLRCARDRKHERNKKLAERLFG
ncbi:hypothetical protein CBL_10020 [Carabus blaptoides fortunei]